MPWQDQQHSERVNIREIYEELKKDKTHCKEIKWDGDEWTDDDADCKFD